MNARTRQFAEYRKNYQQGS